MGHSTLSFFSFIDVVENAVNHRNRLLFGVLNANWGAARWIHGTGIDSFFPLFVSMENFLGYGRKFINHLQFVNGNKFHLHSNFFILLEK